MALSPSVSVESPDSILAATAFPPPAAPRGTPRFANRAGHPRGDAVNGGVVVEHGMQCDGVD